MRLVASGLQAAVQLYATLHSHTSVSAPGVPVVKPTNVHETIESALAWADFPYMLDSALPNSSNTPRAVI